MPRVTCAVCVMPILRLFVRSFDWTAGHVRPIESKKKGKVRHAPSGVWIGSRRRVSGRLQHRGSQIIETPRRGDSRSRALLVVFPHTTPHCPRSNASLLHGQSSTVWCANVTGEAMCARGRWDRMRRLWATQWWWWRTMCGGVWCLRHMQRRRRAV